MSKLLKSLKSSDTRIVKFLNPLNVPRNFHSFEILPSVLWITSRIRLTVDYHLQSSCSRDPFRESVRGKTLRFWKRHSSISIGSDWLTFPYVPRGILADKFSRNSPDMPLGNLKAIGRLHLLVKGKGIPNRRDCGDERGERTAEGVEGKGKKSAAETTHFHRANGVAAVFAHWKELSILARGKSLRRGRLFKESEDDSIYRRTLIYMLIIVFFFNVWCKFLSVWRVKKL